MGRLRPRSLRKRRALTGGCLESAIQRMLGPWPSRGSRVASALIVPRCLTHRQEMMNQIAICKMQIEICILQFAISSHPVRLMGVIGKGGGGGISTRRSVYSPEVGGRWSRRTFHAYPMHTPFDEIRRIMCEDGRHFQSCVCNRLAGGHMDRIRRDEMRDEG